MKNNNKDGNNIISSLYRSSPVSIPITSVRVLVLGLVLVRDAVQEQYQMVVRVSLPRGTMPVVVTRIALDQVHPVAHRPHGVRVVVVPAQPLEPVDQVLDVAEH